jgi:hypothetical protein
MKKLRFLIACGLIGSVLGDLMHGEIGALVGSIIFIAGGLAAVLMDSADVE